jgi:hypothetical protein
MVVVKEVLEELPAMMADGEVKVLQVMPGEVDEQMEKVVEEEVMAKEVWLVVTRL